MNNNKISTEDLESLVARVIPNLIRRRIEFIEEVELGDKLPNSFFSYDLHYFLQQDLEKQDIVFFEFEKWCKEKIRIKISKHYKSRVYFIDYSFDEINWKMGRENPGSFQEMKKEEELIIQNAVNYYFE